MYTEKEKNMPRCEKNSVREVTRRILKTDGNTLTLALGFLICLVIFIAIFSVSSVFAYLVSPENIFFVLLQLLSILIMLGGTVFLFLPCVAGYMNLSRDIANGKDSNLLSLFSVYRKGGKYFRSMWYTVFSTAYAFFFTLVLVGGFVQFRASANALVLVSPIELLALVLFWLCSFIAAVVVLLYISSYLFFVSYLYLGGAKLKDAVRMSVRASKTCRAQIIKQEFLYLLYLLLGILTLGVVLVIRSAPKITVSYFVFGNRVFGDAPCEM